MVRIYVHILVDFYVCIYDINLNTFIFNNHEIHNDLITCLINKNQYQFISFSIEHTIKIWKYWAIGK